MNLHSDGSRGVIEGNWLPSPCRVSYRGGGGFPGISPPLPKFENYYVIIAYTWNKTAVDIQSQLQASTTVTFTYNHSHLYGCTWLYRQFTGTGAITTVVNAWLPNSIRINLRALTFSNKFWGGTPTPPPLGRCVARLLFTTHKVSPPPEQIPVWNHALYVFFLVTVDITHVLGS